MNHKKNKSRIPEDFIWKTLYSILKGLSALHKKKILHRDLKCANVFLIDGGTIIKIGDLNVSKVSKNNMAST